MAEAGSPSKWNESRKIILKAGDGYGKLKFVCDAPNRKVGKTTKRFAVFRCDCGSEKEYQLWNVLSGNSVACDMCRRIMLATQGPKNRKSPGLANANVAYYGYRKGAKTRKLCFDIDFEFFLEMTQRPCHYCGSPPSGVYDLVHSSGPNQGKPRCNGAFIYNGLDRFANNEGYTEKNCVPCCWVCNKAKGTMSGEEFVNWIRVVFKHLNKE